MSTGRVSDALPPPRLVLATRNPGKIVELRRLLASYPWRLLSLDEAGFSEDVDEPADTYLDNAGAKAAITCTATGLAALADDSGIEVDALHGWPGARSTRWRGGSDGDRLLGLIDEVNRRTPEDRRVRYVCVAVLARPGGTPVVARGECLGTLLTEPRGSGGFGYDPAFLSRDLGITFGDASQEDKDRVSHRARAIARLAESGVLGAPAQSLA
ncbi:MAG: non-canonical purine NTP pyrophosphatase [Candidatus Dormibacteraeota bacterium]|nr:non-canonical purine NTP pyrophosphatase [Candidatus Dormibacteraeota bacterium]